MSWQTTIRAYMFAIAAGVAAHASGQNWEPLLHDPSLANWKQVDGQPPGKNWEWSDGILHLKQGELRGGNLLSTREYGDFELVFEWKIASRGNNGVKYRVRDYHGKTLGIEYQMIDDVDYGGLRPEQTTGAVYDLFEPAAEKPIRPVGEYNRSAIIVHDNHLEHYLNGRLVAEINIGSDSWREHVAASKFHDAEAFGENAIGRIMLTDHNSEVWFRNMFIRRFDCDTSNAAHFAHFDVGSGCTSLPAGLCCEHIVEHHMPASVCASCRSRRHTSVVPLRLRGCFH